MEKKDVRSKLNTTSEAYHSSPDSMLMNGKGSYLDPLAKAHESFTVTPGKETTLIFSLPDHDPTIRPVNVSDVSPGHFHVSSIHWAHWVTMQLR